VAAGIDPSAIPSLPALGLTDGEGVLTAAVAEAKWAAHAAAAGASSAGPGGGGPLAGLAAFMPYGAFGPGSGGGGAEGLDGYGYGGGGGGGPGDDGFDDPLSTCPPALARLTYDIDAGSLDLTAEEVAQLVGAFRQGDPHATGRIRAEPGVVGEVLSVLGIEASLDDVAALLAALQRDELAGLVAGGLDVTAAGGGSGPDGEVVAGDVRAITFPTFAQCMSALREEAGGGGGGGEA
jgi:hypothetical protein